MEYTVHVVKLSSFACPGPVKLSIGVSGVPVGVAKVRTGSQPRLGRLRLLQGLRQTAERRL